MKKLELLEHQEYLLGRSQFFFTGAIIFFIVSFLSMKIEVTMIFGGISIILSIISIIFKFIANNLSN